MLVFATAHSEHVGFSRHCGVTITRRAKRIAVTRHVLNSVVVVLGLFALVGGIGIYSGHLKVRPFLSGSVRPVAQPGDLVVVKQTPTSTLHVGEVVAFYPPGVTVGAPCMHRIVTLSRTGSVTAITTKGDANNVADPWGPVTVRGTSTDRLAYVIPKLGFVSVWAHNIAHNPRSLFLTLGRCIVLVFGIQRLFGKPGTKDDHVSGCQQLAGDK